jgi:arginine-tRNA-protein transferase
MSVRRPRVLDGDPPELLVYDEQTDCPYLEARTARLPMRLPTRPLSREEFGRRLERGDRRQGLVLYNPACPECRACEPIRIDVSRFEANRSQRRALKRGDEAFEVSIAPPSNAPQKVELYNRHKLGRALLGEGEPIDESGYGAFLVDSCTESFEMRYRIAGELVGVAVVDRAADALSAVYTYFNPAHAKLSPGVYSILKQIELCRRWGLRHLYLGLYVEGCSPMEYKAGYRPHERRIDGHWRTFGEPSEPHPER